MDQNFGYQAETVSVTLPAKTQLAFTQAQANCEAAKADIDVSLNSVADFNSERKIHMVDCTKVVTEEAALDADETRLNHRDQANQDRQRNRAVAEDVATTPLHGWIQGLAYLLIVIFDASAMIGMGRILDLPAVVAIQIAGTLGLCNAGIGKILGSSIKKLMNDPQAINRASLGILVGAALTCASMLAFYASISLGGHNITYMKITEHLMILSTFFITITASGLVGYFSTFGLVETSSVLVEKKRIKRDRRKLDARWDAFENTLVAAANRKSEDLTERGEFLKMRIGSNLSRIKHFESNHAELIDSAASHLCLRNPGMEHEQATRLVSGLYPMPVFPAEQLVAAHRQLLIESGD